MSWEAVTWANKQKLKKSYEQIVLLVLANCADPNGEAFVKWPGRDHWWIYLSDRTRLPKSSLFRHLNTLVALGLGERTMQVLADGSRRPTFKLNMNAAFDIDLPEDAERYEQAFSKASPENQSPPETGHDDTAEHDENDSDISASQGDETPIAPQSPRETGPAPGQSPVGTGPFPVLRPQEDSKTFSKESPPTPQGGPHTSDDGFLEFKKAWGRPIERLSVAEKVWNHVPSARRGEALAAAKGYFAWVARQRKEPAIVSAQTFLRETAGWAQWLVYAPDVGSVLATGAYPLGSPEAKAIAATYDLADLGGYVRDIMIRNGAVNYRLPITPRLLAMAGCCAREDWKILTLQQAAAWNGMLGDAVPIQTRKRLKEGDRAPWPWPPSVEGKLYTASTDPPDVLMTDADVENFK